MNTFLGTGIHHQATPHVNTFVTMLELLDPHQAFPLQEASHTLRAWFLGTHLDKKKNEPLTFQLHNDFMYMYFHLVWFNHCC